MTAHSRPKQVVVTGAFDDLRSGQIRFLEEAARLGEVTALLWADDLVRQFEGKGPKFPEAERAYVLKAIRFVRQVVLVGKSEVRSPKSEIDMTLLVSAASKAGIEPDLLVVSELQDSAAIRAACQARGIDCRVLRDEELRGFPERLPDPPASASGRKRVVVTGCYDWVHSGHVRFFEEVSSYGDLYVILGHDANIRLLKGAGHPLFPQEERRYVVASIRYVTQALITTGDGWLDADPEIRRLKPDIYAVNEDGDRGGKQEYCAKLGIEYLVLKRVPAPGLPQRTSTDLRGF
jgi:cytidyltransferase-like protein